MIDGKARAFALCANQVQVSEARPGGPGRLVEIGRCDAAKTQVSKARPMPPAQANAGQGAIDLDEQFDSDDDAAHPNCECVLTAEIEDEDD